MYYLLTPTAENTGATKIIASSQEHAAALIGASQASIGNAYESGNPIKGYYVDECPESLKLNAERYRPVSTKDCMTAETFSQEYAIPLSEVKVWCINNKCPYHGRYFYLSKDAMLQFLKGRLNP